jgi:hypothetical protein
MPWNLGDLRNAPLSLARLPKLDVAGSSPVARSFASPELQRDRRSPGHVVPRRFFVGIIWVTQPPPSRGAVRERASGRRVQAQGLRPPDLATTSNSRWMAEAGERQAYGACAVTPTPTLAKLARPLEEDGLEGLLEH